MPVPSLALDTPQLAEHYEKVSADRQFIAGQALIAELQLKPGERALDVGCGTGLLADYVADRVGTHGAVVGFDPLPLRIAIALAGSDRDAVEGISQLYVGRGPDARTGSASLVRLDSLVEIESTVGPSRIDRVYRQRFAALRAGVGAGYGLADRLEAVKAAAADMHLPNAYSTRIMGRGRELERTFGEFIWAFALSIVFMYMILASQFESLLHPLTILLSLPLSVPFALFSLWATGNTLNLYSALGILVLFGVVKKNSILQVDHMNKLRDSGLERTTAILQANRDRLRPILMTTLALVFGMLPLWVGSGPGAEERRAIAVVVIGGQSLSLLLTLIVTPVAYSLFEDLRAAQRAWWGAAPSELDLQRGADEQRVAE